MANKKYWVIIFLTIAINVMMVQWTVESYLGREYEQVVLFSGIAIVSACIAFIALVYWKRVEYEAEQHE
ncbi:hypothetical protein [Salipaludibacillus daqingensis]|uniref:hypothetical protein n=1 Tax=Salipaludibacillus daqingensis TaxID=3041001 RepID=UPI002472F617|nr:hypothetical protein [Salipaludibacillus daqingensis]